MLVSSEPCVSGEVRIPLYRLAIGVDYPGSVQIDSIDFNLAFGNPDTIKLTDFYVTEEGRSVLLYKCEIDENLSTLRCFPGNNEFIK